MTRDIRGVLWICDYFPRPHDTTTGTWALESAVALRRAGLSTIVAAPTPWIPRWLAFTSTLHDWARVPGRWELRGVPVRYPRCPHYPRRWVRERVYRRWPMLDTAFLWPWCRAALDGMMRELPIDVIHANFLFPAGYLGWKLKERHGTPLVVHERSVQRLAMAEGHPRRGRAYRRVLRAADAVITENRDMAARLGALEPTIPEPVIFRQPGGHADTARNHARERPSRFRDKLVVLSVGALSERKGHAVLLRAVAELRPRFPDLVCLIVGEGPEAEKLRNLAARLELGQAVELLGKLPHEEVLAAMSWCDVFALPSWGEAGGTVYAEAMQFGIPIIACLGEGIADVVRDGVHGRLVRPRDPSHLAEALRKLLRNGQLRRRMGLEARELAEREFSYPRMAERLSALYGELADATRQSRRPA